MRVLYMYVCLLKNSKAAEPVESYTKIWAAPMVASGLVSVLGVHMGPSKRFKPASVPPLMSSSKSSRLDWGFPMASRLTGMLNRAIFFKALPPGWKMCSISNFSKKRAV